MSDRRRFCTACGTAIDVGDQFCPECGAPQQDIAANAPAMKTPARPADERLPDEFQVASETEGDDPHGRRRLPRKVVIVLAVIGLCLLLAVSALAITGAANVITGSGGKKDNKPLAYPWIASLYYQDLSERSHKCTGSLIAPEWVLTAAHCVTTKDTTERYPWVEVTLGLTQVGQKPKKEKNRVEIDKVAEDALHLFPDYQPVPDHVGDVALIHLNKSSSLSPTRLVEASEQDQWTPGNNLRMLGWGKIHPKLQSALLNVHADKECERRTSNEHGWRGQYMLCAGGDVGGANPTEGDSGGPLFLDSGGTTAIAGVTSRAATQNNGYPAIFARVGDGPLRDWITATIAGRDWQPPPQGQQDQQQSPKEPQPKDIRDYQLTPQGLGPIHIGMTIDEAIAASGGALRRSDRPGALCPVLEPADGSRNLTILTLNGQIRSFDTESSQYQTSKGVRVGDSIAKFTDAYSSEIQTVAGIQVVQQGDSVLEAVHDQGGRISSLIVEPRLDVGRGGCE